MAHARLVLAGSVAVVMFGCGGSGASPAAEPDARRGFAAEPLGSFQGTRWGTYHSKRFELSLGLPDGAGWKIDDHRSAWLRATHSPTQSSIGLRTWGEEGNVTRSSCYARAREWDPELPDLDAMTLIDDRTRLLFGSRDVRVAVGIVAGNATAPATGGIVVAVSADVRRCIVLAFRTQVRGPSSQDEVADRLVIVADKVLPSLKLDQSFTPSREPAIPPPAAPGGF